MSTRFKLAAAALGLVIATGAIADASATTLVKTTAAHGIVHKKVKIVRGPHRPLIVGHRVVKRVRIVHRLPTLVTVVKTHGPKVVIAKPFHKKIVTIVKAPLVKHAMIHRGKAIIVR